MGDLPGDALGHALDQRLRLAAEMNQVGDGADFQAVFLPEFDQVGQSGHAAVVFHDFADHRGGREAGQCGQIATGFRVPGAHQHAARFGRDREYVPGRDYVLRFRPPCHRRLHGAGAVMRRNPRGDPRRRFDRDGKGRAVGGAVLLRHRRELQLAAAFLGQGETDQAARESGHEVDRLGRDEIRGEHEIALVLAVFLIHQDYHFAGFDVGDDFLGAADVGVRLMIKQAMNLVHVAVLRLEPRDYKRFPGGSRQLTRT